MRECLIGWLLPRGSLRRRMATALRRKVASLPTSRSPCTPLELSNAPRLTVLAPPGLSAEELYRFAAAIAEWQHRPLDVLALVDAVLARPLLESRPAPLRLVTAPDSASGTMALPALAGEFLLRAPTVSSAAEPLVMKLLGELTADPLALEVRGESEDGLLVLSRNPPLADAPAEGPVVLLDAQEDEVRERCARAAGNRRFLWFGSDPDRPYLLRDLLAEPGAVAATADPACAARLALLTPRWLRGPSAAALASRAAALSAARDLRAELRPLSRPGQHVVLQADHFTEGGLEQVVIDLARSLQANGFRATLLILGRAGPAAERAHAAGLWVERLEPEPERYSAFLREREVAIVNAHYSTFGAELAGELGLPFVQTLHNTYLWFGDTEIAAYRRADEATAAYVCVSNNVARYADLRLGLPVAKMVVIPNGCDDVYRSKTLAPECAAKLRRELAVPPRARLLLNVASIQPAKAQHVLLSAFARIAADEPDAHLCVLGAPVDAAYAEAQVAACRRLGLAQRVHWLGHRADVASILAIADALVSPSFFEGWSLAITEAVLAGLPVVATEVGGALEQLRDTDGILVAPVLPDLARAGPRELLQALPLQHEALQERLALAMREVLALPSGSRRRPRDVDAFGSARAYSRYANLFRWLAQCGAPEAARYWCRASEPAPGTDACS